MCVFWIQRVFNDAHVETAITLFAGYFVLKKKRTIKIIFSNLFFISLTRWPWKALLKKRWRNVFPIWTGSDHFSTICKLANIPIFFEDSNMNSSLFFGISIGTQTRTHTFSEAMWTFIPTVPNRMVRRRSSRKSFNGSWSQVEKKVTNKKIVLFQKSCHKLSQRKPIVFFRGNNKNPKKSIFNLFFEYSVGSSPKTISKYLAY